MYAEAVIPSTHRSLLNERCDPLELAPSREDLLRFLGYPASGVGKRQLTEELEEEIRRGQALLRPRGIYSVYPIEQQESRYIRIGGKFLQGQVAEFLAGAESVAVFIVSVGPEITRGAEAAARAGNIVAAWALDALGSWATEAAAEALIRRLSLNHPGEGTISPRYSPGYCGMRLNEQRTLFELVDASTIGCQLMDSMLMQPHKSVSGLAGIGPVATFATGTSPCDRCGAKHCSMRR